MLLFDQVGKRNFSTTARIRSSFDHFYLKPTPQQRPDKTAKMIKDNEQYCWGFWEKSPNADFFFSNGFDNFQIYHWTMCPYGKPGRCWSCRRPWCWYQSTGREGKAPVFEKSKGWSIKSLFFIQGQIRMTILTTKKIDVLAPKELIIWWYQK